MKFIYTLLTFLFIVCIVNAQRFDGQWKGGFSDNSTGFVGLGGNNIDYVLEIQCKGSVVSGYSYTYFVEGNKRCYTICKLTGTLNKTAKEVTVTEIERTKYNTPPDFRNCFQTHKLKYSKNEDGEESLEGTWVPAPNQTGDCGFGKTLLSRRIMKNVVLFNKKTPVAPVKNQLSINSKAPYKAPKKPAIVPKALAQNKKIVPSKTPAIKQNDVAKKDDGIKNAITSTVPSFNEASSKIINEQPKLAFEKRSKELLKTINIEKDTFTVDLYDNGEIDGDSVSVFYNNKLLMSHKRLTDKPISLKLNFNNNFDINELTMYAENLGTIPPNTALMVITDGTKRYEVRITSDTEKNGTVGFTHKLTAQ